MKCTTQPSTFKSRHRSLCGTHIVDGSHVSPRLHTLRLDERRLPSVESWTAEGRLIVSCIQDSPQQRVFCDDSGVTWPSRPTSWTPTTPESHGRHDFRQEICHISLCYSSRPYTILAVTHVHVTISIKDTWLNCVASDRYRLHTSARSSTLNDSFHMVVPFREANIICRVHVHYLRWTVDAFLLDTLHFTHAAWYFDRPLPWRPDKPTHRIQSWLVMHNLQKNPDMYNDPPTH